MTIITTFHRSSEEPASSDGPSTDSPPTDGPNDEQPGRSATDSRPPDGGQRHATSAAAPPTSTRVDPWSCRRWIALCLPAVLIAAGATAALATQGNNGTDPVVNAAGGATATTAAPAASGDHDQPGHDHDHDHDHDQAEHDHDQATEGTAGNGNMTGGAMGGFATGDDVGSHQGLTLHDNTGGRVATAEDEAGAAGFITEVTDGVARYRDIGRASADGYHPNAGNDKQSWNPVKHYSRGTKGNGDAGWWDPTRPGGLIYKFADDGAATLIGVVFISPPGTSDADLPQPGGPLTVWHDHASMGCPAADPDCGQRDNVNPPKMLHVWFFDGVVQPFAHDYADAAGVVRTGPVPANPARGASNASTPSAPTLNGLTTRPTR